jgi:flavorubredoxin
MSSPGVQQSHVHAPFGAVRISEHVYWVGAIDWRLRDFHGYATPNGTTYNAYLIIADKITLIDGVKAAFVPELLARVASVIDPHRIDYVVSNHAEMDHSGGLPAIVEAVQPEQVFASVMGAKALAEHQLLPILTALMYGATIDLGNLHLTCLETRMLHWPDSMFTYLAEDRLLFSNDAFGMHLARSERFDDEIPVELLRHEAAKYYANILLPYSHLIVKLFTRLQGLNLPLDTIAPDHGPIWRGAPNTILDWYGRWANGVQTDTAVVIYDTMWESTAKLAQTIGEGLADNCLAVQQLPLAVSHRSDVATSLLEARALLVGSPTLNNNIFPTVADTLTYLKGLKPRNLVGAAFGSYGWSGEAVAQITEYLTAMKVELVTDSLRVKYVPDAAGLQAGYTLGATVADILAQRKEP